MDGVAETVDRGGFVGVVLCDDLVDVPFRDVEDFEGEMGAALADDAPHAFCPLGVGGFRVGAVGFGEEDEHPFVPGLDHAD